MLAYKIVSHTEFFLPLCYKHNCEFFSVLFAHKNTFLEFLSSSGIDGSTLGDRESALHPVDRVTSERHSVDPKEGHICSHAGLLLHLARS